MLESEGNVSTAVASSGNLNVTNNGGHCVLWLNRWFPPNFNWTFVVSPRNSSDGLNIVFFGAAGNGSGTTTNPPESIFDLRLPARTGIYNTYTRGAIQTYSVSYFRINNNTEPDVANLRKNPGFHLAESGIDRVGYRPGPDFHVEVSKVGSLLTLSVDGKQEVQWTDSGVLFGPVYGPGFLGLRQMSSTGWSTYRDFVVRNVSV